MTARTPDLTSPTTSAPLWTRALTEQIRILGLGLRREGMIIGGLVLLVTGMALFDAFERDSRLDFPTDASFVLPLLALVAPFAIWKGERLFGNAHLWSLPVERSTHALIKVLAGAFWVYAALLAIFVWLVALAAMTGGAVFGPQERLLIDGPAMAEDLRTIQWTTPPWQWASLLTGTLIAYLLGSALVLGVRYPLRWIAGVLFALMLASAVSERAAENITQVLLIGPFGLDNVLSGGTERLDVAVRLPNGDIAVAWQGLPTVGPWAAATALWFVIASAALWLAAWRHRER